MATKYEYYDTGGDLNGSGTLYGVKWVAQSFTPSIAHTITSVKLYLAKVGSPGTLTFSIRATAESGAPTGGDLATGTTNGNTLPGHPTYEWREITLGAGCILSSSVRYAIVARALTGDQNNEGLWELDITSATYLGGFVADSGNSGSTWNLYGTYDALFEEWGDSPTGSSQIVSLYNRMRRK